MYIDVKYLNLGCAKILIIIINIIEIRFNSGWMLDSAKRFHGVIVIQLFIIKLIVWIFNSLILCVQIVLENN